jgi:hypothetical protein
LLTLLLAGAALTSVSFAQIDSASFAPKVDFAASSNPWGVALGDVDGDGKRDMVVAISSGTNLVSVYRNTSTPGFINATSFAPAVNFPAGDNPSGVAIGDLDGDSKSDMVAVNTSSFTISVFRSTSTPGNVSFEPKVDFATGSGPFRVVIGDVDGDGKPDLAVDDYDSNSVSIFRNTSTSGSISFEPGVNFTTGAKPYSVAIGDVDGDGKLDLTTPNRLSDTVSVFRNTSIPGNVSFELKADFATASEPSDVLVGDVDGDGKAEIAVTNQNSNIVSVLLNTSNPGSISFAQRVDFSTGINPFGIALGDLDADGKADLAVANRFTNYVSVFENTSTPGSISFAPRVDFATGTEPLTVAIGDVDGDGKPDMAVTNWVSQSVSVFKNANVVAGDADGDGIANATDNCPTVSNSAQLDADGDGIGDACDSAPGCPGVAPPPNMVSWWPGDGNAFDIQGGHHGTPQNGATFAPGKVGQAFSFDGVDDHVNVPDAPSLRANGQLTIDFWAKFNSVPRTGNFADSMFLIEKDTDYLVFWRADLQALEIDIADGCDGGYHFGAFAQLPTLQAGVWHHYTLTALERMLPSDSEFHIYFDGAEQSVTANSCLSCHFGCGWNGYGTTGELRIGMRTQLFFGPLAFNGFIDELELFDRVLSQSEIQALYDAGSAGKCKPVDTDNDGVPNASDNCPAIPNPDQLDTDADGQGNACDADDDNDGVPDATDNCPLVANTNQADNDHDGIGNACDADDDNDGVLDGPDNCDFVANPGQQDTDGDGIGNACDPDDDNDGVPDGSDQCPGTPAGTPVTTFGCPVAINKDQCKNDGWKTLFRANGTPFKNQGDCIQYVNTGK